MLVCEVRGQSVALSPHLPENNRVCLIFFFLLSDVCLGAFVFQPPQTGGD